MGRHRRDPERFPAALILIEHHWTFPIRDAVARAGGTRISDGFIDPLDLVEAEIAGRRILRRFVSMAIGSHDRAEVPI